MWNVIAIDIQQRVCSAKHMVKFMCITLRSDHKFLHRVRARAHIPLNYL
jgi:hypothetical protein